MNTDFFRAHSNELETIVATGLLINQLLDHFDELERILGRHGVELKRLPHSESLQYLRTVPHLLPQAVERTSQYLLLLNQLEQANINFRDEKTLVWNALKILKLKGHAKLLDWIEGNEVIEIYNSNGIQIFRNLKFFEHCTYCVEHIFTRSFYELYRRPSKFSSRIIKQGLATFLGFNRSHSFQNIPPHTLREEFSVRCRQVLVEMKVKSPLYAVKSSGIIPSAILTTMLVTE